MMVTNETVTANGHAAAMQDHVRKALGAFLLSCRPISVCLSASFSDNTGNVSHMVVLSSANFRAANMTPASASESILAFRGLSGDFIEAAIMIH